MHGSQLDKRNVPLHLAARDADFEMVKALVDKGAKVNIGNLVSDYFEF